MELKFRNRVWKIKIQKKSKRKERFFLEVIHTLDYKTLIAKNASIWEDPEQIYYNIPSKSREYFDRNLFHTWKIKEKRDHRLEGDSSSTPPLPQDLIPVIINRPSGEKA